MGKKAKSSRHHYIQKFLIKGFVNTEQKVFVYDKEKEKILKDSKSPKSIFFEEHRNTITFKDGSSTSIIEDELFNKDDNKFSKLIRHLQYVDPSNKNIFNDENISEFLFFIINLFWRIPYSDGISEEIIQNAISKLKGFASLKDNDSFLKQQRALLYINTLSDLNNLKRKTEGSFTRLFPLQNDLLVIGDNPIVYSKSPKDFDDLFDLDFCIAIKSNRLIMNTLNEVKIFDESKAMDYNYTVISQSRRYVCSGDMNLLEATINYYNDVKDLQLISEFQKKIFKN